jgi:hypothetical protein
MKLSIFLFALLGVFLAGSCKKDPATSSLSLVFNAEFDGKQADLAKTYQFGNNTDVQFTRFNLFLCDIALVKADGSLEKISEVEFLDFTAPNDATSIMEPIRKTVSVPDGKYTGLQLGYGLNPTLNAKKPSSWGPNTVLGKAAGEFWDSWGSYIFMKIEGRGENDGDPDPEVNMVYHCGSDAVYRTATLPINLEVKTGVSDLNVAFDLKKLFYADSEWLDIESSPRTSDNPGDVKVATIIMDRMNQAVTIK